MKNINFKLKLFLLTFFIISVLNPFFLISNVQAEAGKSDTIKKLFDKGRRFELEGSYGQAIEVYTQVIEIAPELAEAYFNRGLVYKKKNEFDNALADYSKAIEKKPDFAMAYNNRGNIFNKKREFEKAIKNYSKAVSLDKNYALAYFNRCTVWEQKGEIKKAVHDLKIALKLKPGEKVFIEGLKYLETRLEKTPALDDIEKIVDVDNAEKIAGITYVVLKNVNVRSGPSIEYEKTGEIYKGVTVTVEKIDGDWAKLGKRRWVYAKLLSKFEVNKNSISGLYDSNDDVLAEQGYFIAKVNINIRRGPSTAFMHTGKILKGTKVEVIEITDGWAKIGEYKWVLARLLDNTGQGIKNQTTDLLQPDKIKKSSVFVKEESLVQKNVGRYFADRNINIRSGPSQKFSKLGLLKAKLPVYVVESVNGWAKIGVNSWIYGQLLVKDSTGDHSADILSGRNKALFVISKTAVVRLKPALDSNNIGMLEKGLKVVVFEEKGDWARIGEDKWINKKFIEIEYSMPVKSAEPEYKNNLYVVAANLVVRSGPSTDHGIVASLIKGMYIDVKKIDNDWAEMGENKWVYAKYLKKHN